MLSRLFTASLAGCAPVLAVALLLAGCASAPPLAPPVVSYETKISWILRLEDQRVIRDPAPPVPAPAPGANARQAPPPPSRPDLVQLLEDEDARVRRRASLALGRLGLSDAVPALSRRLAEDVEPEVRQIAGFALGLIGDRAAAGALRQAMADSSPLVRGRAVQALGLVGDESSAGAIGEMVAAGLNAGDVAPSSPDDLTYPLAPEVEVVRLGIYALARLGAFDALAQAVLDERGQPLLQWWPVAFALQRVGDDRAIPALRSLAATPTVYTRAFAVRGLGERGDQDAGPLLTSLIEAADLSPLVVVEAIRAAGRLGIEAASPALSQVAFSATMPTLLRAEAVRALAGTGAGDARDGLIDLLSDRSAVVRAAVLETLARLDGRAFLALVSGLEPDAQWSGRAALATALGHLPPELASSRLLVMLDDTDARVIPAVLNALTRVRAPNVESILLERLRHEDPVVRMAAANGLAETAPAGAGDVLDALEAAYRFGERDTTYVARAAALSALATLGEERAAGVMADALEDQDWAVRVRAAELLASLDPSIEAIDAIGAIRPAPGRHAPEAYGASRLVAPVVSPHVYIDTDKGTIEIEMAVIDAPLTTDNFMDLARRGFFDGVAFHRVVSNFVIQAGDPRGDGEGGPGYTIRDEINPRPYLRGVVGMALDWRDTGGSQFFITHSPHPHLDGQYTAFGHVVSGMDVVDRIEIGDVIRQVRVWDGVELSAR